MPKIVRVWDMTEHEQEIIERLSRSRTAPARQVERARMVQWSSDGQRVRRMGLRRSGYIGEPRTHLQHVVKATAINMCRVHDWLKGIAPHSTPLSHFARFMKRGCLMERSVSPPIPLWG